MTKRINIQSIVAYIAATPERPWTARSSVVCTRVPLLSTPNSSVGVGRKSSRPLYLMLRLP